MVDAGGFETAVQLHSLASHALRMAGIVAGKLHFPPAAVCELVAAVRLVLCSGRRLLLPGSAGRVRCSQAKVLARRSVFEQVTTVQCVLLVVETSRDAAASAATVFNTDEAREWLGTAAIQMLVAARPISGGEVTGEMQAFPNRRDLRALSCVCVMLHSVDLLPNLIASPPYLLLPNLQRCTATKPQHLPSSAGGCCSTQATGTCSLRCSTTVLCAAHWRRSWLPTFCRAWWQRLRRKDSLHAAAATAAIAAPSAGAAMAAAAATSGCGLA